VAVISNGWTPQQRTVVGTLATIADDVTAAGLPTPAVTVVGDVVDLRRALGDLVGPTALAPTGVGAP
jgi:uroporphyrin-III C-methyltransferase/precorrin-2 dehydrogenase/sirohydrochlorin ferrochelatase